MAAAGSPDRTRVVIVAARNEADRIVATIGALKEAFPRARIVVSARDSTDATPQLVADEHVELVPPMAGDQAPGKGGGMTAAARYVLGDEERSATVILCDGDLGRSARSLGALADAVEANQCDLAIASFARREGGGFGVAVGFARWAIKNLTGVELRAPISGQRALRSDLLRDVLPFAPGYGMETGMTIDAARAGARIKEIELDLEHRATGRTAAGFLHRARQLADFARVYLSRRFGRKPGSEP
jgi:glycosyltransferase involved in cell wall biosynthesis